MAIFGFGKKKPTPPVEAKQKELEKKIEEKEAIESPFVKKDAVQEQKKFVDEVRTESQKLKDKLQIAIAQKGKRGVFSDEQMEEIRRKLKLFMLQLDTSTATIDTRELDQELGFFVESLEEALRDGNVETAERILTGLQYGIMQGHKDIKDYDMIRMDQIMEVRCSRLDKYKQLVILSKKIDEHIRSNNVRQKKYDMAKQKYEDKKKALLKEADEHPELIAEIDEVGADKTEKLSPEALELVQKQNSVLSLKEQLKQLKQTMRMAEGNITALEGSIKTLEVQLADQSTKLDQETLDMLKKIDADYQKQLIDLRNQMLELDKKNQEAQDAFDLIFSSPEMKGYVIGSQKRWEAVLDEDNMKEMKAAKGKMILIQRKIDAEKRKQELDRELKAMQQELDNLNAKFSHQEDTLDNDSEENVLNN